jgi:hypothetical protein
MCPPCPSNAVRTLAAAFLGERALREVDGVNSFIRVVDRWTVTGPTETMPQTAIPATLVVIFKSGIHRGSGQLVITPTSPSDVRMAAITLPVLFEGDEGLWVVQSEGAKFWLQVLTELQKRGVTHT